MSVIPSAANEFHLLRSNCNDAMTAVLAEELGLPVEALHQFEIGWSFTESAWAFPEYDPEGNIIGITLRRHDGTKFMVKGSKRGLFFSPNPEYGKGVKRYNAGRHNWIRVADAKRSCPVCEKTDWCLISRDNPANPSAVICARVAQGAVREIPNSGYLHILQPDTGKSGTILRPTDLPILIVEGASDVMAAAALEFVAVGRPSGAGGITALRKLPFQGKEVYVIGENDAGAGKDGMEKTYAAISQITPHARKFLPPEGIKDLRAWVRAGLTQDELLDYAQKHGENTAITTPDIFPDGSPETVAGRFVKEHYTAADKVLLRKYRGQWLTWQDGSYHRMDVDVLRGQVYKFASGKSYLKMTNGGPLPQKYEATRKDVTDILDALNIWSPVPGNRSAPMWLMETTLPAPKDLIAFRNGLLDVNAYINGQVKLYPPDPALFNLCTFPYDFDEDLDSPLCREFFSNVFASDPTCVRLIQQWFGYNCVPDTSQEKLMLFTGRPRSGKSTTMEILGAMLGDQQLCAVDFGSLTSQFGREPMLGKLAAVMGDMKSPRASEQHTILQMILRITGQDAVPVDCKGVTGLSAVKLVCRFTMAMNDLPTFSDDARALSPRMNILYFPNSFVGKEDFSLKERLVQEAREGKLIRFALEGLASLRKSGRFVTPKSSSDMSHQMEILNTPAMLFGDECCKLDAKGVTKRSDMYEAWCCWCRESGRRSGSREQFGRWFLSAYPCVQVARRRVEGEQICLYEGVVLQDWAKARYLGVGK